MQLFWASVIYNSFFFQLLFYSDTSLKLLKSALVQVLVFDKERMSQGPMDKNYTEYFKE